MADKPYESSLVRAQELTEQPRTGKADSQVQIDEAQAPWDDCCRKRSSIAVCHFFGEGSVLSRYPCDVPVTSVCVGVVVVVLVFVAVVAAAKAEAEAVAGAAAGWRRWWKDVLWWW